ncbi:MAG TPA: cyclopropane-fatty-acyl-phospholipid synthase family protein [Mycobacteriales bacterium]|nr:cyclopropane-fatty-acyl-phospholipid synthase family protein [Mycobacteriales bacterium]
MSTTEHAIPMVDDRWCGHEAWPALQAPRRAPLRAAVARAALQRVARRVGLRVELPDGAWFGAADGSPLIVHRPGDFFLRLGRDGKIGFGEAYMAGDWDAAGDLAEVLELMARDLRALIPPRLQWLRRLYEPTQPGDEDNDPAGARRNVARHYDLSNELFGLFLDPTMTYSSALFARPDETLEQAQIRKIERLLDATLVADGTRVLEIGTGWGELAIRAARRGAQVTSLTLSREQAAAARRRVADEGLSGSVEILEQDYRQSSGRFDAVVSVEMIEAVGERWWPVYFETLERRLAPGGRIGIQSILMDHDTLLATRRSWTWVHKYIFPGGIIPSLDAIEQTLRDHTHLRVLERLHFASSYAATLARWRASFDRQADAVERLGFDAIFRRMWDFYLAYAEAGFRSGHLDVAQLVMSR